LYLCPAEIHTPDYSDLPLKRESKFLWLSLIIYVFLNQYRDQAGQPGDHGSVPRRDRYHVLPTVHISSRNYPVSYPVFARVSFSDVGEI